MIKITFKSIDFFEDKTIYGIDLWHEAIHRLCFEINSLGKFRLQQTESTEIFDQKLNLKYLYYTYSIPNQDESSVWLFSNQNYLSEKINPQMGPVSPSLFEHISMDEVHLKPLISKPKKINFWLVVSEKYLFYVDPCFTRLKKVFPKINFTTFKPENISPLDALIYLPITNEKNKNSGHARASR